MLKRIKTILLPLLAPFFYYTRYRQLKKEIDGCFHKQFDVFCFFPAYHIGGAEKVHLQILRALKNFKVATFITYKSKSDTLKEDFKNASHFFIDIGAVGNYPFFRKKLALQISVKLNAVPYTCTLFGCNNELFYLLLPLINNTDVRKVDLLHAFAPYITGIEQTSIKYVQWIDTRLVVNKKTAEDYKGQYLNHAIDTQLLNRIQIISNALDTRCIMQQKKFTLPLRCLFVGRGSPEKRFPIFLALADKCNSLKLPITFTAVGDLEQYKIQEKGIRFLGEIREKEGLQQVYAEHHILLTTSVYEGFPLTIMEAMCMGLVNISTDVGGIPEHIHSHKNGFLIRSNQPEEKIIDDFFKTLIGLTENTEQLAVLSTNSILYAQQHFNMDAFREKYNAALINSK